MNPLMVVTRAIAMLASLTYLVVCSMTSNMVWDTNEPYPDVSTHADRLVQKHDCWTGEAPMDVIVPGAVVMALPGHGPHYYTNDAVVGRALDYAIAGEGSPVHVYAFCR